MSRRGRLQLTWTGRSTLLGFQENPCNYENFRWGLTQESLEKGRLLAFFQASLFTDPRPPAVFLRESRNVHATCSSEKLCWQATCSKGNPLSSQLGLMQLKIIHIFGQKLLFRSNVGPEVYTGPTERTVRKGASPVYLIP